MIHLLTYELALLLKIKVSHPSFFFNLGSEYRFGLVWFDGISTFVGYLRPNPFLCK